MRIAPAPCCGATGAQVRRRVAYGPDLSPSAPYRVWPGSRFDVPLRTLLLCMIFSKNRFPLFGDHAPPFARPLRDRFVDVAEPLAGVRCRCPPGVTRCAAASPA